MSFPANAAASHFRRSTKPSSFGPDTAKPPRTPPSSGDSRDDTAPSTRSSPNARNRTASPAPSHPSQAGFPPLVTQVHDLRYEFRADGVRFIRKSSLGFVFRKSARIVANSAQTATWLQREYGVPENKIGQCRIHLTAPFLHLAGESPADLDPVRPMILFLGALNRKKAPDVFLRAALLLVTDLPGATFVLLGPETSVDLAFHATLHELAFHRLLVPRIESLGRLDPAAVIDQIRRARVVVCPSRIETFSRTTIEALALGRPVIVTDTTGAAHWVQSTGCGSVVPPDDPSALARAIRDWTSRENVPNASAAITSELTAARAAEDWIREVTAAISCSALTKPYSYHL